VVRLRGFRALDYEFTVTVDDDDALSEYVPRLFASLGDEVRDPIQWRVRRREDDEDDWELLVGDVRQATGRTSAHLVPEMVHALNTIAIPAWDGVVCHAGGVVRDGAAVVLPADMESGKSTLTTGLVRAGYDYLTDEGVAFHRGRNLVEPYPKPISIDPGSWFLFPDLEPRVQLGSDDDKRDQWQVPPEEIRPGCVASPCAARLVVFPKYVEGAATELIPMGRAEGLLELAKNTFSFNLNSRFALTELAVIVREVNCHRLTVGDLLTAVGLVDDLVSSLPTEDTVDP
jgi:hypothetical protein